MYCLNEEKKEIYDDFFIMGNILFPIISQYILCQNKVNIIMHIIILLLLLSL